MVREPAQPRGAQESLGQARLGAQAAPVPPQHLNSMAASLPAWRGCTSAGRRCFLLEILGLTTRHLRDLLETDQERRGVRGECKLHICLLP